MKRPNELPARLVLPLALAALAGCQDNGERAARNSAATNANAAGAQTAASTPFNCERLDAPRLDAEIVRLESQAERSPGDEETLNALSRAYLCRADSARGANRLREALRDYQNALRANPDNEEAKQKVAEISPQQEDGATGENGEPAPLPITPNVTTGEAGDTDATPQPTPKKRKS